MSFTLEYVKDLNYGSFHHSHVPIFAKLGLIKQSSVLYKLAGYFYRLFHNILIDAVGFRRLSMSISGRVVFFPIFLNHWEPMEEIKLRLDEKSTVLTVGSYIKIVKRIPMSLSYLLGIPFIPYVVFMYFLAKSEEKRLLKVFLHNLILSYGYDLFWKILLCFQRPKAFFFANDHVFETRAVMHCARARGIPIFYIQHAPVGREFPRLQFTASFLEGQYSADCYAGSEGAIYLIGNMKFETFRSKKNVSNTIRTISVATNQQFDLNLIYSFIEGLKSTFSDMKIMYRPHPVEYKDVGTLLAKLANIGVEISIPDKEKTFDFLSRTDVVISGASGIMLEAALMNVTPIYLNLEFPEIRELDSYELKKNEMCYMANTEDQVFQFIRKYRKSRPPVSQKIGYYYSNAEKPAYPEPFQFIADVVNKYINEDHKNIA